MHPQSLNVSTSTGGSSLHPDLRQQAEAKVDRVTVYILATRDRWEARVGYREKMYFQPVHNLHFCPNKEPPATSKEKKGSKIESKCFNGPESIRNQDLDKKSF